MRSILGPTLIVLLAAGCSAVGLNDKKSDGEEQETLSRMAVRGDPIEGERIGEAWCNSCHSVSATGTASDVGPAWSAIASDPSRTDDYLKSFLTAPHWPMENISLSQQQILDVIAYIRKL